MSRIPLLHALAAALWMCAPFAHAQFYTFKDLGSLGVDSVAAAINPQGRIAGTSYDEHKRGKATLWRRHGPVDLGPAGEDCHVTGMNKHEQIAGWCRTKARNPRAVKWVDGVPIDLAEPSSAARGINAEGIVVGQVADETGAVEAVKWASEGMVRLGTLPRGSIAAAINGTGKIAGWGYDTELGSVAVVWDQGVSPPVVLPWDGGTGHSYAAYGINGPGQIVGTGWEDARFIAARWDAGHLTRLAPIQGGDATAQSINNAGVAVGSCSVDYPVNKKYHAVMWASDGSVTDLNDLVDAAVREAGWVLEAASDINESGQIVGYAKNRQTRLTHAFLLTPATELTRDGADP